MNNSKFEGYLFPKNIFRVNEVNSYYRKGELDVSAYNEDKSEVYSYKISLSELVKALNLVNVPLKLVRKPRQQYCRLFAREND